MSTSTMQFWGGPLDGTSEPPEAFFPAPPVYKKRDIFGGYYVYVRDRVTEDGTHVYLYERHEVVPPRGSGRRR